MTCTQVSGDVASGHGAAIGLVRAEGFGTEIRGKPCLARNKAKFGSEKEHQTKTKNQWTDPLFAVDTKLFCLQCLSRVRKQRWGRHGRVGLRLAAFTLIFNITTPLWDAWEETQKLCCPWRPLTPSVPLFVMWTGLLAEERACDWWRTTPEQGASDNAGSWLAPQNLAVQSAADLNRAFVCACLHMHAQAGGSGDGGSPVETQRAEKSICVSQCWWRITKICTCLQTKLRKMFYILAFLGFCVCA